MPDISTDRTLDLEHLRTFETVVRLGGFTPAAEALHKTQSTVSAQLKKLEETTGERLMLRNNQGIRLTPAGETLLSYSRRMLKLNAEAMAELHGHQLGGRVRVGVPSDYAPTFLSRVLSEFGRAFPRVEVQVHCDLSFALHRLLIQGELDLAIGNFADELVDAIELRTVQLAWAGLPDGEAAARRPLPLALFPETCEFREAALRRLRRAGLDYRIAYSSPDMSGIEAALLADFAVGALARGSIRAPLQEIKQTARLPALPAIKVSMLQAAQLSDAARKLADAIRGRA